MAHKTYDIIEQKTSSITADALNQERNLCLITGFCKPPCCTNTTNNPYTMYQYHLIQQYSQDSLKLNLYTFLSYEKFRTNSIILDEELTEYDSDTWQLFAKEKIYGLRYLRCAILILILCLTMCITLMFIFPLNSVIHLVLIILAIVFAGLTISCLYNYILAERKKYYIINFNVHDRVIQRWHIKPRKLKAYGSLRLYGRDRFVFQVNRIERICNFKALKAILVKQWPGSGKIIQGTGTWIFKADLIIDDIFRNNTKYCIEGKEFDTMRKEIRQIIDGIHSNWWQ